MQNQLINAMKSEIARGAVDLVRQLNLDRKNMQDDFAPQVANGEFWKSFFRRFLRGVKKKVKVNIDYVIKAAERHNNHTIESSANFFSRACAAATGREMREMT